MFLLSSDMKVKECFYNMTNQKNGSGKKIMVLQVMQLCTIFASPWFDDSDNNDYNKDEKYQDCNTHPFSRVLLMFLGRYEGVVTLLHVIDCT